MRGFLTGNYHAVLFEVAGETVAYALYVDHPDHADTIYLRQIFVHRARRRQGIGREAMRILMQEVWPPDKRLTVEVLVGNSAAQAFYEAVGFQPCSLELEVRPSQRQTAPGGASTVGPVHRD
jgi:GNAT superfamily N-acetyltransferase